jgi:hypothetical protein
VGEREADAWDVGNLPTCSFAISVGAIASLRVGFGWAAFVELMMTWISYRNNRS